MDYICTESSLSIRDLVITTWRWEKKSLATLSTKPPVIAIHGGPAFCHNYILPLILLCDFGHPVIFYDQAGCGKSSFVANPQVDAPHLLTLEYYVEELSAIIEHHKLDSYVVYGSSWGTIVAQEFAVLNPTNLQGLILDGALSDSQLYISSQWRVNLSTMPTRTQQLFKKLVDDKDFDSPTFKAIESSLSVQFTSRYYEIHVKLGLRSLALV